MITPFSGGGVLVGPPRKKIIRKRENNMDEVKFPTEQEAIYNTMHNCDMRYRHISQGIKRLPLWLHMLPAPPASILEVGCGNGRLCKLLVEMGYDVVGLDIVQGPYERSGYEFHVHDLCAGTLPFKDKEFDVCLSFDVIEHLPTNYDETIAEMVRVSKSVIGVIACFRTQAQGLISLHPTIFDPKRWIWKISELAKDPMGFEIVGYNNPESKAIFYYTQKKG